MALPATDDFNRADNAGLGANWTQTTSGGDVPMAVVSNHCDVNFGGAGYAQDADAFWSADVFANDQYSQLAITVVGTGGGGAGMGVLVRAATGKTFYRVVADHAASNNVNLRRFNAGTGTDLQSWTHAFTDGDVIRLEVSGSILTVLFNGVALSPTVTDGSPIASGSAGVGYSSVETSCFGDTWEGGNVGGTSFANDGVSNFAGAYSPRGTTQAVAIMGGA